MIPDLDWSNPAVVKRYRRKIMRRSFLQFGLLPFLIGLLPVAGFTLYRRFHPEKAEQQRQRVREYINTQLDSPATKGDLLYVMLMIFALGVMAMLMLQTS